MAKQSDDKLLANVSEEYVFRSQDGRNFRNMADLLVGLRTMSDETFAHHSNRDKNDFSNWVRDIIQDDKLARDLKNASLDREQSIRAANRRIAYLNKLAAISS